MLSSLDPE